MKTRAVASARITCSIGLVVKIQSCNLEHGRNLVKNTMP